MKLSRVEKSRLPYLRALGISANQRGTNGWWAPATDALALEALFFCAHLVQVPVTALLPALKRIGRSLLVQWYQRALREGGFFGAIGCAYITGRTWRYADNYALRCWRGRPHLFAFTAKGVRHIDVESTLAAFACGADNADFSTSNLFEVCATYAQAMVDSDMIKLLGGTIEGDGC